MKYRFILWFIAAIVMIVVMQWQGRGLVTPASPHGILDYEFARVPAKLAGLQLFNNARVVRNNLYLDFLLIATYVGFFIAAAQFFAMQFSRPKLATYFIPLAITAGMFDVAENFLLILILNGRFAPELLSVVFFCAIAKFLICFLLVVFVIIALLASVFRRRQ